MQIEAWLYDQIDAGGAAAAMRAALGASTPDLVILQYGAAMQPDSLRRALVGVLGERPIHGASSCQFVMANGRVARDGLAVLAICDPQGRYGTASTDLGDDPRASAARAVEAALAMADRSGESPDLVWLSTAPGPETQVLAGIKDVVGPRTRIVGGSAADDDMTGRWSQLSQTGTHASGLVVSVLFPSVPVASIFHSGYTPSERSAIVTGVAGRRLLTLDGRPAGQVYQELTGIVPPGDWVGVGNWPVMAPSTWAPLGQVANRIAGVPFHVLSQPAQLCPDGSMVMLSDLVEGERCWIMQTTPDALVQRAGTAARAATQTLAGGVAGGLLVYCAGCMLALDGRLGELGDAVVGALGGSPMLGVFGFGEQGCNVDDEAKHGNLMISCTVFGRRVA